jgi:hypothetical protein
MSYLIELLDLVLALTWYSVPVTDVEWPTYTLDDPQNLVFDANVTELVYAEPDTYRAEGIAFLVSQYANA